MSVLETTYKSCVATYLFTCVFAVGCDQTTAAIDPIPIAKSYAVKELGISASEIESYQIRVATSRDAKVLLCEFYADSLVGDRDLDEMESMWGGFPDYFTVKIDAAKGVVIDSYAESR